MQTRSRPPAPARLAHHRSAQPGVEVDEVDAPDPTTSPVRGRADDDVHAARARELVRPRPRVALLPLPVPRAPLRLLLRLRLRIWRVCWGRCWRRELRTRVRVGEWVAEVQMRRAGVHEVRVWVWVWVWMLV